MFQLIAKKSPTVEYLEKRIAQELQLGLRH
jgi:hypothetical protein